MTIIIFQRRNIDRKGPFFTINDIVKSVLPVVLRQPELRSSLTALIRLLSSVLIFYGVIDIVWVLRLAILLFPIGSSAVLEIVLHDLLLLISLAIDVYVCHRCIYICTYYCQKRIFILYFVFPSILWNIDGTLNE